MQRVRRLSDSARPRWADSLTGQIWIPDKRSEKDTSPKRIPRIRSEKDTRCDPISTPENRSEKDTTIKIKQKNETNHKPAGSAFLQKKRIVRLGLDILGLGIIVVI